MCNTLLGRRERTGQPGKKRFRKHLSIWIGHFMSSLVLGPGVVHANVTFGFQVYRLFLLKFKLTGHWWYMFLILPLERLRQADLY